MINIEEGSTNNPYDLENLHPHEVAGTPKNPRLHTISATLRDAGFNDLYQHFRDMRTKYNKIIREEEKYDEE